MKRVIGIAGSDEKCNWLKSIGADAAVNYKSATFSKDLAAAAPDGIDKLVSVYSLEILLVKHVY